MSHEHHLPVQKLQSLSQSMHMITHRRIHICFIFLFHANLAATLLATRLSLACSLTLVHLVFARSRFGKRNYLTHSSHRQNSNPVSLSRSMASPAAIRPFFQAIAVLVHTRTRRNRDSSLRTRDRYFLKAVHDHWKSATRSARVTELVFAALSRPKIKFAPDTAPGPNTEPDPFIKEGQACLSQACSVASSSIDSAFHPSNGPTALAREIASSFRDTALFAFVARSAPVLKVSTLCNRVWITFFLSFAARL